MQKKQKVRKKNHKKPYFSKTSRNLRYFYALQILQ